MSDLATTSSVLPTPLLRVLRALAAFGVFRVGEDGSVARSPRSMLLRTDEPNSPHHGAKFWTAPGSWKASGVLDSALAGGVPNQAAWGMDRFQYLRKHPAEARIFDAFMANFPDRRHQTLAVSYDFSGAKLIVDIGGGNAGGAATNTRMASRSTRGGFRPLRRPSCHTAGSAIGRKD